jgi:hypothetical protein
MADCPKANACATAGRVVLPVCARQRHLVLWDEGLGVGTGAGDVVLSDARARAVSS